MTDGRMRGGVMDEEERRKEAGEEEELGKKGSKTEGSKEEG